MVGSGTRRTRSRTRLLPIRSLKLLKGSSLMGPFVLHLILRRLPLTPTQIQTRTIALSELSRQERKRSLKSCSQAVSPTKRTMTSRSTNQPPQAQQTRGRRETTASVTATPSGPDSPDLCPMPHTKRAILADLGAGEEIAVMVGWTRSPEPADPPETEARTAGSGPPTTPLPDRQPLRVSNSSNRPQGPGPESVRDKKRASSALSAAPGRLLIRAGARGETRGRRTAGGRPGIENKPSNSPPKRRSYPLRQNPRPKVQL